MIVYRITLAIHADKLAASGNAARWNSKDVHIIYTSSSRALACLENIVHRNSRGMNAQFRVMVIDIPKSLSIGHIDQNVLPDRWQEFQNMHYTQQLGDKWIASGQDAILRVPSVIIPGEYNYLLNPAHKEFRKIKLVGNEPFEFDGRLKN